jgi:hypothetical protein
LEGLRGCLMGWWTLLMIYSTFFKMFWHHE